MKLKVESITTFAEDIFDGIERLAKRAKMERRPFSITDGVAHWSSESLLDALYETGIEEGDDTKYALKDDDFVLYEAHQGKQGWKFYKVYWVQWEDESK